MDERHLQLGMLSKFSTFRRVMVVCGVLVVGPLGSVVANATVAEAESASPSLSIVPGPYSSVSCATARSCMAVGSPWSQTLTELWNGTTWSTVPSPNTSAPYNELSSVSCASPTSCMAVGSSDDNSIEGAYVSLPLAEFWNGAAWSIVPTPYVPGDDFDQNYFQTVSCTSTTNCMALGTTVNAHFEYLFYSFMEMWNGTVWTSAPGPMNPPGLDAVLTNMTCWHPSSCMAAGYADNYNEGGDQFSFIFESWNGSAWSLVPSPDLRDLSDMAEFTAISCASAHRCVALGESWGPNGQPVAASWDGSSWSIVLIPHPSGSTSSRLSGLSCPAAHHCVATGGYSDGTAGHTLVESWDGTAWSIVPNPDLSGGGLSDISCGDVHRCMVL